MLANQLGFKAAFIFLKINNNNNKIPSLLLIFHNSNNSNKHLPKLPASLRSVAVELVFRLSLSATITFLPTVSAKMEFLLPPTPPLPAAP